MSGRARPLSHQYPFLETQQEIEAFEADYTRYPRTVRHRPSRRREQERAFVRIDEWVAGRFDRRLPTTLMGVSVHDGDGMSWTAQAAYDAAGDDRAVERVALRGTASAGRVPDIVQVTGFRRLARLARHRGLTEMRVLDLRLGAALVAGTVLLGVVGALLEELADGALSLVLLTAACLQLLALAAEWARSGVRLRSGDDDQEHLAKVLTDGPEADRNALADDVARELRGTRAPPGWIARLASGRLAPAARVLSREAGWRGFPRCVVVDGYEKLDPFTRTVVNTYLGAMRSSEELWVVFDSATTDELVHWAHDQPFAPERGSASWRRLDLLTEEQLATFGDDEAAAVGVRRRRRQLDLTEIWPLLERLRDSDPEPGRRDSYSTLHLFYLLSLDAGWGGNPLLPRSFIEARLGDVEGPAELARRLLPGTSLEPEEIGPRVRKLELETGGRLMVVEGEGRGAALRILPEVARCVVEARRELGMPSPGLGHLYWALTWHRWLVSRPVQGFWLRKLASHLQRCDYDDVRAVGSPDLEDAVHAAALFAIDGCLATCLIDDLARLLDAAVDLVPVSRDWERRGRPLLDRALRAYEMTGRDDILEPARALDGRRPLSAVAPETGPLERMLLSAPDALIEPLVVPDEDSPAVNELRWALAAWLAETLAPITVNRVAGGLHAVIAAVRDDVPDRIDALLARLAATAPHDRSPTELATLSTLLWCRALASGIRSTRARGMTDVMSFARDGGGTWADLDLVADSLPRLFQELVADGMVPEGEELAPIVKRLEKTLTMMPPELRGPLGAMPLSQIAAVLASLSANEELLRSLRLGFGEQSAEGLEWLLKGPDETAVSDAEPQDEPDDEPHSWLTESLEIAAGVRGLRGSSQGADFPLDAAGRDVALTVAACADLVSRQFSHFNEHMRERLGNAVDRGLSVAGISPARVATARSARDDTATRVASALDVLAATWSLLELPRLEALTELRHRQYRALAFGRALTRDAMADSDFLYADFLDRLIVAQSERSAEYEARELARAVAHVLDEQVGEELETALCILLVSAGHKFTHDLHFAIRRMLEPTQSPPRKSRLAVHLEALDDDDISEAAIRWMNAASRDDHPENAAAIELHLHERAAAIKDEALASRVKYALDSVSLRTRVVAGDLAGDAAAELVRWKEAHGRIGAFELYLLLPRSTESCPAALLEEANALLEEVSTASMGEMMLAGAFLRVTAEDTDAARSAFSSGRARAIAVLEDNIEAMEGTSALSNAETRTIYAQLYEVTSNEKYLSRFAYWHALEEAHAAVERSESLVATGRYFEDFRSWVNAFRGYGLAVDSGEDLAESPEQRRARSRAWLAEGVAPAQPLLQAGDGVVVCSRFVLDGQAILSTGAGDSPDVAAARERFNALAGAALPLLRAEVTRLPDLPDGLREMLVRYNQRLREYSAAG